MNIAAAVLIASGLIGSSSHPPFQALAQTIVHLMQETGRRAARQPPSGPVMIDMQSFEAAAQVVGEQAVDAPQLLSALGPGLRASSKLEAIQCTVTDGRHRCEVPNDGMFIRIISATPTIDGVAVLADVNWTDRRPSGSAAIGTHRLRLTFRSLNDAWILQKSELVMET